MSGNYSWSIPYRSSNGRVSWGGFVRGAHSERSNILGEKLSEKTYDEWRISE